MCKCKYSKVHNWNSKTNVNLAVLHNWDLVTLLPIYACSAGINVHVTSTLKFANSTYTYMTCWNRYLNHMWWYFLCEASVHEPMQCVSWSHRWNGSDDCQWGISIHTMQYNILKYSNIMMMMMIVAVELAAVGNTIVSNIFMIMVIGIIDI